jgi:hypothetical protein
MTLGLVLALVAGGGWLEVEDRTGRACLDARRLEAAVARHLGRAPFPPEGPTRVRAFVRRSGRGLAGRLEMRSTQGGLRGSRAIAARGGRCADLESALALSLVLALAAAPEQPEPPEAPTATEVTKVTEVTEMPAPVSAPAMPPEATSRAPASPPAAWRAWLGAGGVIGALPGPGFGPALGGSAQRGVRSLAAEARFEGGIPVRLNGARVRSWRATGTLLPCLAVGAGRACGGVRAGFLHASSARSSTAPTLELTGRLQLDLQRGAVTLYAEPAVSLIRTRLRLEGAPAWTMPRFSAGAGLLFSTR